MSELLGAAEAIASLQAKPAAIEAACVAFVNEAGALVEGEAKGLAPVRSGQLRRSLHTEGPIPLGGGAWMVRIMPETIYARRIELGFYGADSLGRQYHQMPRPYLAPAMQSISPLLEGTFVQHMHAALHG